jgi:hypothetical protein
MPCFAFLRTNTNAPLVSRDNIIEGRNTFKTIHRVTFVLLASIFSLILLVCLREDGYINPPNWVVFLPSMIILWISTALWCIFVGGEVTDNEDTKGMLTACAWPQTLFAICLTLIAFQPNKFNGGETMGTKFTPIYVSFAPMILFTCLFCVMERQASAISYGALCAGMGFIISWIVSVAMIAVHIDGGYGDNGPSWFLIFLPTFIADFFIFGFICFNICINCHSHRSINEAARIKFTGAYLLAVGWLVYFVSKIMFIVREDNIPLYYTLGNVGALKLRDTSMATPAMFVAIPFLLLGLYLMTIDCTMPVFSFLADKHISDKERAAERNANERRQEREAVASARQLGHRIHALGSGDGPKPEIIEMTASTEEKNSDTGQKTITYNENNSQQISSESIQVLEKENNNGSSVKSKIKQWKGLLIKLELCETSEECIVVLKDITSLVESNEELKVEERKMEVIKCAKEKRARADKEIWNADVAVEFRHVLDAFSILAALGLRMNGLRQMSKNFKIRNPFKRSASSKEDEEEQKDDTIRM